MSRTRLALGALALVLGLVLGLRFAAPRPSEPPAVAAAAPPPVEAPAERPPVETLPAAVQRYLEQTRYPPTSGRLDPEDVGLLEPNRRFERPRPLRETLGPDADQVVLVELSADRYDLTGGEPTSVWLEARRGDAALRLAEVRGSLWREGRAGREGDAVPLRFAWSGRRHEAELDLEALADHHGFVVAEVRYVADGHPQVDTLRFSHTPEDRVPARFTGQQLDYVRDGALVVEVGLDVVRAGFFRLDANLYDAAGRPVAYTAFKGELEAGRRFVPLEVFGKVLRDAGVPGPYALGDLRGYRFVDGAFPDREVIPGPAPGGLTGPYALAEFSDAPWESESKRRMVELMLEDEAAGIALDLPPAADAAAPGPGAPAPSAAPAGAGVP